MERADLVDADDRTPVDPRARGLTPDHPAYLIYTSGSTGAPKGIVVSHRNICHYLRAANEVYGLRADDVVFQGASVAFDLAMEEIWIPFLVGATLWVADASAIADVERLPDVLDKAGVTVLDTVPTLLAMLRRDIPSLRVIILGGESLSRRAGEALGAPGPAHLQFIRADRNDRGRHHCGGEARRAEVTIGRPIANYTCYVADETMRLVAPGATGELLIGGPGVCRGYLGRADLSAHKFIRNPFRIGGGADPVLDPVGRCREHRPAREPGVSRTDRRAGQDPRISHRAGRDRSRLERGGGDRAGGRDRPARMTGSTASSRSSSPGRRQRRCGPAARAAAQAAAVLHGVPAHFEFVAALPRLVSGKVDRNALRRSR